MAAGAVATPRNEVVDIADLLSKVAPLFIGTEKDTGGTRTEKSTIDPAASAQADQLFSTLMGRATSTTQTDAVVNDILYRAQLAFAPVLGDEKAAGVYNSQTRKLLANEAVSRATAAAGSAVLQSQEQALNAATSLTNAKTNASKTATATETGATKTPAAISGQTALLGLGASVGAGQLAKLIAQKKKEAEQQTVKSAGQSAATSNADLDDLIEFLSGGQGSDVSAFEAALNTANPETVSFAANNPSIVSAVNSGDTAYSSLGLTGAEDFNSFTTLLNNVAPAATDFTSAAVTGAASEALPAVADIAADTTGVEAAAAAEAADVAAPELVGGGSDTAAELLGVAGGAAGGFEAAGGVAAADEIIGGILGADAIGGTAVAAGGGLELADLALTAAAWVICTELKRTGELDAKLYADGARHISRLSDSTIRGYHFWAIPYTRWMRRSNLARSFIRPWAVGRAKYLSGQRSILGWFTVVIGEPACTLIGKFCGKQDYKVLYGTSN